MKTRLFILVMMLSTLTCKADIFTDHDWFTLVPGEETTCMILSFEDDGMCALALFMMEELNEDDENGNLTISYICPGTYTLNGNCLDLAFDISQAKVDFELDDNASSETKYLYSLVKSGFEDQRQELLDTFNRSIPIEGKLTIESLDEESLTLIDEAGDKMTFGVPPSE